MEYDEFIDVLELSARSFVRTVSTSSLEATVPACPGWTLGDLTNHLGGIHRWAHAQITGARDPGGAAPRSTAPLEWFDEGAAQLVAALRDREPTESCWTLYPPAVTATWARRQALETMLHLWDASKSVGRPVTIAAELASEGVREVVEDLYPRQVALGRLLPLDCSLEITLLDVPAADGRGGQPVRLNLGGPGAGSAAEERATLELSAEDALLVLWKRRTLAQVEARSAGSERALRTVLAAALVP